MHIQRIAHIRTLQRDGVVKISGVCAVDGHRQKIAKILPRCAFPACDLLRHLLGLHQRFGFKRLFQPIMADDAQQIRLCRARFAQDLDHFALRIAVVLLVGGNFCHHKQPPVLRR